MGLGRYSRVNKLLGAEILAAAAALLPARLAAQDQVGMVSATDPEGMAQVLTRGGLHGDERRR